MFTGREKELEQLEDAYCSKKSELVTIYGRRRIGKSALIENFAKSKNSTMLFEAIEGSNTQEQINHFKATLAEHTNDRFINNLNFTTWRDVFSFLTEKFIIRKPAKAKLIISFDEIQWMAVQKSQLISLIKYFWDNYWKQNNVMLILCGSVASFVINKVLNSRALYGRISQEICLKDLPPKDILPFFASKRSPEEVLKYLLVFGGVPKYFEEINMNKSFNQNINRLCFSKHALMLNEIDRMFYSQYREAGTYLKIVKLLKDNLYALKEIGEKLNISSGGSLRSYLTNLENADMIQQYIPFNKSLNSKIKKFTLSDEFLRFYFKFMEPNLRAIQSSESLHLFETLCEKQFSIWAGFAFEKFCIKHSYLLGKVMGFGDDIILTSPYFGKKDSSFQIDLLYLRSDKVITLCEIKHWNKQVTTKIIPEIERKVKMLTIPRGYTVERAVISLYGCDKSLKESGYLHHDVTFQQILQSS